LHRLDGGRRLAPNVKLNEKRLVHYLDDPCMLPVPRLRVSGESVLVLLVTRGLSLLRALVGDFDGQAHQPFAPQ
jgi:hypothetical protein